DGRTAQFQDTRHLRAARPTRRQARLPQTPAAHHRVSGAGIPASGAVGAASPLPPPRAGREIGGMTDFPRTAMVLAAGLGRRMRPITDTMPKPLVRIAGRSLLDRGLDALAAAGVEKAVVNVHHFPEQMAAHVASREGPGIIISDESELLLDSAGAIV